MDAKIVSIWHLLLLVYIAPYLKTIYGAKILLYPLDTGFNSRLMNMIKIADILSVHGHNTTVIINNRINKLCSPKNTTLLVYDIPETEKVTFVSDDIFLEKLRDLPNAKFLDIYKILDYFTGVQMPFCRNLIDSGLLRQLKTEQYDLIMTDILSDCGKIVIDYLDIPAMTYSNWGFVYNSQVFYPYVPSFVCTAGISVCASSKMNFTERLSNIIFSLTHTFISNPYIQSKYDALKQEYGLNVTRPISKTLAVYAPVIVNGDFILDYPRPLMPHIIMLQGLYHKKPKELEPKYLDFIEGSAPHGVVVVSFGSLVPKIDDKKAEIMAAVFGRLKQRVIWRHIGAVPKNLRSNTMLVNWFPQSDILAHPLIKMFVTHCGISGTYETAFNGVPVVAMPMFMDQEYNARKLVERGGMGLYLSLNELREDKFEEAVNQAIHNRTYKDNAMKVSQLLKDREVDPEDKLLYWVNYVIRHRGATHLISETALSMSLFKYFSLDVILFCLIFVSFLFFICICTCYFVFSSCRRLLKKRKDKIL